MNVIIIIIVVVIFINEIWNPIVTFHTLEKLVTYEVRGKTGPRRPFQKPLAFAKSSTRGKTGPRWPFQKPLAFAKSSTVPGIPKKNLNRFLNEFWISPVSLKNGVVGPLFVHTTTVCCCAAQNHHRRRRPRPFLKVCWAKR